MYCSLAQYRDNNCWISTYTVEQCNGFIQAKCAKLEASQILCLVSVNLESQWQFQGVSCHWPVCAVSMAIGNWCHTVKILWLAIVKLTHTSLLVSDIAFNGVPTREEKTHTRQIEYNLVWKWQWKWINGEKMFFYVNDRHIDPHKTGACFTAKCGWPMWPSRLPPMTNPMASFVPLRTPWPSPAAILTSHHASVSAESLLI